MTAEKAFSKRITAFALMLMLGLGTILFAACGGAAEDDQSASGPAPGTVVSESAEAITIVDQAGREVEVGRDIASIAVCYRVVIRFLLSLDQGEKIKGIGKSEEFLEMLQPSLSECADVGKGVADIEAMAELAPDLFIHKASDTETLEAVQKLGIPSIGIDVEDPDDMLTALEILGRVCGAEERAAELSEYYTASVERSRELSGAIADADKKTAVVMGSSVGKVADGSMLQGRMLEDAGAVNCAGDMKASELWPTAGTEQIFSWDPDYIFISGSGGASYDAEDIYSDPAWSELKAVKERHVYVMPSALDSWEFPGIVSSLGTEYMMSVMYPELVSDEKLEDDAGSFYELAYRRTFSREELGY